MNWKDFFQKGMSEDNGNPSARRIVMVYSGILLTTLAGMTYFIVAWWMPTLVFEMTTLILGWIAVNIITGIVAKSKEQKVEPEQIVTLRAQEAELKKSNEEVK